MERGGEVRAKHVADMTAKTLRDAIVTQAHRSQSPYRRSVDLLLAASSRSTAPSITARTNTSKTALACSRRRAFFALLKRGVFGAFHSISEQHLQRYCDEFAFRWNNRPSLGVEDFERANQLVKGAAGKRLTYRPTDKAQDVKQLARKRHRKRKSK